MITPAEILEEVSNVFDCPVSQMQARLVSTREADARHAAIFLLKTQTFETNNAIAVRFGYKNKDYVCRAKLYAEQKMQGDKQFHQKIIQIVNSLMKLKLNLPN